MNTRIVELIIDEDLDEFGGVDGVALVSRPAHEENWLAFNTDTELKNIYEILDDLKMEELGRVMGEMGEKQGVLEEDGYELYSIEPIHFDHNFSITSKPNDSSGQDAGGDRIRYKYVGPRDEKNRHFCKEMMTANRVYRIEDIQDMTQSEANAEFGYYDIFRWRGSFNCRHFWVKLTYKPSGMIINKSSVKKGVVSEQIYEPQERTITNKTANAWEKKGKSTEIYNPGRFNEMLEAISSYFQEEEFESFTDYPQYMTDSAQDALNYIEKSGNPNDCMTQVGKVRAQQLAQRKPISLETIKRMKNYMTRHLVDLDSSTDYETGCGKLAMASWGCRTKDECKAAINWLDRRINKEEMEIEPNPCWDGYEPIGLKPDGSPNCVPIKQSSINVNSLTPYTDQTGNKKKPIIVENFSTDKHKFSMDDDKMEITGAAIVPNKFIIRVNEFNQPYYVFFSEYTTKLLSEKFMYNKMTDSTNIEHTNKSAKAFVSESWIVENTDMDKSKELGLTYPQGTWVITMKVQDPELWRDIKQGKYKGFSVEGFFSEKLIFNDIIQ